MQYLSFYPVAEHFNGTENRVLRTYEPATTFEQALDVIKEWRDVHKFDLKKAWVEILGKGLLTRFDVDIHSLGK